MATNSNFETVYQVGERVTVSFGPRKLAGTVLEDHGAIGIGGRHLYRVSIPMDPLEPMEVEASAANVEAAPALAERVSITRPRASDYLKLGGLISILRSNLAGGLHQPRVWLCLNQLGNVTHTFVEERGLVGGKTVPFSALMDDRIFEPKRAEVEAFVESFGLTKQDARKLVASLGTAP